MKYNYKHEICPQHFNDFFIICLFIFDGFRFDHCVPPLFLNHVVDLNYVIGFIYRQRWAVWIICKINSYTQKSSVARIFWSCKRLWYPYCVLFSQQPSSVQRDFFARDLFDCPRPARSHNTLLVGPEKMKLICKVRLCSTKSGCPK